MKQQYNKINNLVGWITFVIAAFTYCMTIEPTAASGTAPSLSRPVQAGGGTSARRTFLHADS